jgi:hypothetical protein
MDLALHSVGAEIKVCYRLAPRLSTTDNGAPSKDQRLCTGGVPYKGGNGLELKYGLQKNYPWECTPQRAARTAVLVPYGEAVKTHPKLLRHNPQIRYQSTAVGMGLYP